MKREAYEGKRPAFQFYPGDWLRDTALRMCSIGARGLWADMLCIMHQGEPYGHLTVKGKPIELPALARMVGESPKATVKLLEELEGAEVFSRTESKVIYSRRMVKDEHIRQVRADAGKKGGNPQLLDNHPPENLVKQTDKQIPTPSSSSSSSFSLTLKAAGVRIPDSWDTPEFWEALELWSGQWFRKHGTPLDAITLNLQLKDMRTSGWSREKVCRSFEAAVKVNSGRLFDPDESRGHAGHRPQSASKTLEKPNPPKPKKEHAK